MGAALRTPRMCQVPWVPCCWAPSAPTRPRGWWQQSRCQKCPAAFWLAPCWFSFWQGAAGACTAPKCLVVMLSQSPEHGAGDAQQPSVPLGRTSASQCAWGRSQWGQQSPTLSPEPEHSSCPQGSGVPGELSVGPYSPKSKGNGGFSPSCSAPVRRQRADFWLLHPLLR